MSIRNVATRRSRLAARLAVAPIALAIVLLCSPAFAAGHGGGPPSGTPGPGKSGSGNPHSALLPILPDGTPIEPGTWREESTESTDILDDGRWDWELNLMGVSSDRAGGLNANEIDWAHAQVQRGLGEGFELGASIESWERGDVQQGLLGEHVIEAGYGSTSVDLRRRLTAAESTGPRACVGLRARLPGAPEGPGAHVAEGGVFLPVTLPLGPGTNLGAMLEANVVPGVLDTARHLEVVSSMELSNEFTDRVSGRAEVVGVWYGEPGRPVLGLVDTGLTLDPVPHVGLTLGATAGLSGGTPELGWFGRLSVHP
jgi:hypothetical protein